MISVFYLVSNFRWEIEISIQTERIQLPNDNQSEDESVDYSDEYELASTTDEDSEDVLV